MDSVFEEIANFNSNQQFNYEMEQKIKNETINEMKIEFYNLYVKNELYYQNLVHSLKEEINLKNELIEKLKKK